MEDTDWIGFEWIERSMYIMLVALIVLLVPLARGFRAIVRKLTQGATNFRG